MIKLCITVSRVLPISRIWSLGKKLYKVLTKEVWWHAPQEKEKNFIILFFSGPLWGIPQFYIFLPNNSKFACWMFSLPTKVIPPPLPQTTKKT